MANIFSGIAKKMAEAERERNEKSQRERDDYYNKMSDEELLKSDASIARKASRFNK